MSAAAAPTRTRKSVRSSTIVGAALPNIPWQDKPADYADPMWRYTHNPVIPRNLFRGANSIFNSAVVPFKDKFAGVFRCDNTQRRMELHFGLSDDGLKWEINPKPCSFVAEPDDPHVAHWDCAYDPRVCWIEDRYYVTWCHNYHGPTVGMGWTKDFKTLHKMENSLLPCNRNGVLFPRKIKGKYMLLSRPSDQGHTPFGDIFLSQSPNLIHWGEHRFVLGRVWGWQSTKIGAGPTPIETKEGWLLFYHGVLTSCNGYVYSFGACLLDLDEPWKVIRRGGPYLLNPREPYELMGDVPNVTFPCAALTDAPTGRIAIYYGCADTVTGLCFCQVDEILQWLKDNAE